MNRRISMRIVSSLFIFFLFFYGGNFTTAKAASNYDQLIPIAKKYIGVPYKWAGTTVSGFDCSGYINFVYNQIGIDLPRTSSSMYQVGTKVAKDDLRVGDLIFFNTSGSGISHAGIYIGSNQFIHASTSKGVMISNINDPYYWGSKYVGAKRILDYDLNVGQFHDVTKDHWAYEAVASLNKQRITLGYEKSYFLPEEHITRAEVAAMLAEALNLNISDRNQTFNDVSSSHWAVGAINALYKEGIIKGDPNNNFNPDDTLLREHVALMFVKAFELNKSPESSLFNDVNPASYTRDSIDRLAYSGIAKGYPDGSFKPRDSVKRSQFAAFLYRALNQQ